MGRPCGTCRGVKKCRYRFCRFGLKWRKFGRSKGRWENTMIRLICALEPTSFISTQNVAIKLSFKKLKYIAATTTNTASFITISKYSNNNNNILLQIFTLLTQACSLLNHRFPLFNSDLNTSLLKQI